MKKLALVVVLAVVASKLLSEDSVRHGRDVARALVPRPAVVADPHRPPDVMPIVARKGGNRARRAVSASASALSKTPAVAPAWFPKTEADEEAAAQPDASGVRVLVGRLSASEDRARQDLRDLVAREVGRWLAADVPPSWAPPDGAIDRLALASHVQPVAWSLKPPAAKPEASAADLPDLDEVHTLYRAGQRLDFSARRRSEFVGMYRRDVASWRMKKLGGGLAAALGCLAVLATYIRADEATKGYYTNRLRLLAAAGLGAAGAVGYRFLA